MALLFDATGEAVNHGSATAVDSATSWTFICWAKPNDVGAGTFGQLFLKQTGAGQGHSAGRFEGKIGAYTSRAVGFDEKNSVEIMTVGRWSFIATTYDTTNRNHIYHGTDAIPPSETAYSSTDEAGSGAVTDDAAETLYIGSNIPNNESFFNGDIGFVAYFKNRVLSIDQIRTIWHNRRSAKFFGPALISEYWGDGGTQHDLSNLANHGSIVGGATAAQRHMPLRAYPPTPVWRRTLAEVSGAPSVNQGGMFFGAV